MWLFSQACLSLSPAFCLCVAVEPKHGFEVSLKCLVSLSELNLKLLHQKMNRITFLGMIVHVLLLTAGCAQCQQKTQLPTSVWKESLSHGHVQEKTLVVPLGTCNFSEGVCLNYVII